MIRSPMAVMTLMLSTGLPAFADNPNGTACPIVHQQLRHTDYQIVLFGDELKAKGLEIQKALVSTRNEYVDQIGDVSFLVTPNMPDATSTNVYFLCEQGACNSDYGEDRNIEIEYGESIKNSAAFSTARKHIARATIGRIQAVESVADINGSSVLTLKHMLAE